MPLASTSVDASLKSAPKLDAGTQTTSELLPRHALAFPEKRSRRLKKHCARAHSAETNMRVYSAASLHGTPGGFQGTSLRSI